MGKREKPIYTFEDWKKDYHSQPSIPSMSYCIPPEELEKIKIEQKRLFGERVERMEERYKDDYQKKANSSLDLANLQKGEIEFIEDLFYNKNFRTPISNTEGAILANSKKVIWGIGQITGIRLRQVRDAYKKWVIDGETDYSYVKFNDRFDSFNDVPVAVVALKLYYDWVKSFPIVTTQQTETKAPTAPAIALFCNLINEAEIIKKESNEIPETYCKRICENYKLKYTDRVRQNFNGNKSKKHYKELTELILPCIDVTIKDKIQKHLDSKSPPKQKLYA